MSEEYSNYTIELSFHSPLVTPLQSDTIFGHLCWAVRYLKWEKEDRLAEFLGKFSETEPPPLLVSNGFPEGFLPKPILPPVTQDVIDQLFGLKDRLNNSFKIKTIKNTDIIPKARFKELQREAIKPDRLFREMKDCYEEIEAQNIKMQTMVVQHNTIDRIKGRVKKGGLYSQEETFFDEGSGIYQIYLKTNYFTKEDLQRIFTFISEGGYGRDKSTGKGSFTFKIEEGIDLPDADSPDAFMSLSSFIPNENDPVKGYYNLIHKYGKLGGMFAQGSAEVSGNPFKVPLIMFSAGSVFHDEDYKPGKFYGSLLREVHQNKDIRHYAYAFPIGINVEVDNEDI